MPRGSASGLTTDTARTGQEAYDAINAASFTGVDIFLVAFSLKQGREASLENVENKWYLQLKNGGHLQNGAKIILVGTQKDWLPLSPGIDAKAELVKEKMPECVGFFQTSAKEDKITGNVEALFNEACRHGMYETYPPNSA